MPDKGLMSGDHTEQCVGRIAYSAAGRDKKRPFVIIGVCEDEAGMVIVADGRLHKLASPKRKNLKHLRLCEESVDLSGADDGRLREYLKSY